MFHSRAVRPLHPATSRRCRHPSDEGGPFGVGDLLLPLATGTAGRAHPLARAASAPTYRPGSARGFPRTRGSLPRNSASLLSTSRCWTARRKGTHSARRPRRRPARGCWASAPAQQSEERTLQRVAAMTLSPSFTSLPSTIPCTATWCPAPAPDRRHRDAAQPSFLPISCRGLRNRSRRPSQRAVTRETDRDMVSDLRYAQSHRYFRPVHSLVYDIP